MGCGLKECGLKECGLKECGLMGCGLKEGPRLTACSPCPPARGVSRRGVRRPMR